MSSSCRSADRGGGTAELLDAARPMRAGDSPELRDGALAWFACAFPTSSVAILGLDIPKANGFSADIFLVKLKVDAEIRRYVIRRDAQESALFPGLDMSHQAAVMNALHAAGKVPVPSILGEESDCSYLGAPFYVMGHVDGLIPPDSPPYPVSGWVHELPAKDRAKIWWSGIDALAGIAALDWSKAGLRHLLRGTPGQSGVQWEFDYYLKLAHDACGGVQAAFIVEAAEWIEKNMPAEHDLSLAWGDARIGNMIFQGTDCAAVIDWELSTIGAIERDIGWWFYIDNYWHEGVGLKRDSGWPSHQETLEHYQSLIQKPLRDVLFYKAFAAFRSCVTSARATFLGLQPNVSTEDYPPARVFTATVAAF
jgi:aminoglycoside phosphotransferase (APT) family kinase protein